MSQKEVSNYIADELNQYQSTFEYGRIMLDHDSKLRKKYRFFIWLLGSCIVSFLYDIVKTIICYLNNENLNYGFIIGVVIIIISIFLFIVYKKEDLSSILSDVEKESLIKELDNVNDYLVKLGSWFERLSPSSTLSKKEIDVIYSEFTNARSLAKQTEQKLCILYGELNKDWINKSLEFADVRLDRYMKYRHV